MSLYRFGDKIPKIGKGTWIAPSAEIIGDVEIGNHCYIGFGSVIRGDFGSIRIGNETLVEECVVIHSANRTDIGNRVIVGHLAMIHDATILDRALIGMKAMVSEDTVVEEDAIVAEHTHVRKNTTVSAGKIIAGSPPKVVGKTTTKQKDYISSGIKDYQRILQVYVSEFEKID